MIRVEYDSKADAMYIWLRKFRYEISEELAENVVIDLDKQEHILEIENNGFLKGEKFLFLKNNFGYFLIIFFQLSNACFL